MAKNCNTSPFYLQGQSPTIQNQVAIIERFLKKQLPNYAVITVSLNGVDVPKDEFGNVNLFIETIKGDKGDKGDPGEKGDKGDKGDPGIDGTDGIDGADGADGKSAYEIWLEKGHTGTEEDFLEWLRQGSYLKQIGNLDEYEGETDEIVQYIGATNAKYTHGYVYKKVGTEIIIPAGTFYYSINDSTQLMVDVAGLRNGMYFQIEPDEVSANIIIPDFWGLGSLGSGTLGYFPVKIDTQQYTITPLADVGDYIVYNGEVKQIKAVYSGATRFDDRYYTGFSGCLIEGDISCDTTSFYITGRSVLQNEIRVYENEYGDKLYLYYNTQSNSPIALRKYGNKYYILFTTTTSWTRGFSAGNTTSEIVIDTEAWQQLDVQPREDTSRFVTDSEIGWIEH